MCIICISPKGIPQPSSDLIKTMFDRNPHGAGYMVARNGTVEIHTGFMTLCDLQRQLRAESFTADDVVVYHFRLSTQAGITPEMTHPFPLSSDLALMTELDLTCRCGVAHNGVIPMTTTHSATRFSDTALFVADYMPLLVRHLSDLRKPYVIRMLEELTHSRLAILDKTGFVATVGHFVTDDSGLLFSNRTYQRFALEGWRKA